MRLLILFTLFAALTQAFWVHDKYRTPSWYKSNFSIWNWGLRLFYDDGYDHWEAGVAPSNCHALPGPPRKVHKVWHTNSGFTCGFSLYYDRECSTQAAVPAKAYTYRGRAGMGDLNEYEVHATVGSARIWTQC